MEDGLGNAPKDTVYEAVGHYKLGSFLINRYRLQNIMWDLIKATKMFREAVRLYPTDGHPGSYILFALVGTLEYLYARNNEEQALLEAVEIKRMGLNPFEGYLPECEQLPSTFYRLHWESQESIHSSIITD